MECFYSIALPDGGAFDLATLAKQISSDPAVLRHPSSTDPVFIICTSPESVDRLRAKLTANPKYPCDTYGVITLKSNLIWISQNCSKEVTTKIAQFVLPLLQEKHCRIGNEYGVEITDRYQGQFEKLFFDAQT
jgi:hypothetical protein